MARLAIRAIGDKSQRTNVTTGNEYIHLYVFVGNLNTHVITVTDGNVNVSARQKAEAWGIDRFGNTCDYGECSEVTIESETHSA